MALNTPEDDPKKSKAKPDPWGRSSTEGPPDLDHLWRQFTKKLGKTSGGRTGRGSEGRPLSSFGLGGIGLAVLLLYLLSGIYIVQPAERAVVTQLGAYKVTMGPGPHWFARFIQAKRVLDVDTVMTSQHGGMMLTKDENIVNVKLAVQYQIGDPREYLYSVVDPQATLRHVTDSAIRYVIGHSTLDEILTSGRTLIASSVKEQIMQNLELYHAGLSISAVAMQEAEAPEEVKAAFLDAIRAREDEERLVNQAEAYASRIEPIAEGQATRLLEDAKAYKDQVALLAQGETARFENLLSEYQKAPQVMRDRYYIGMMEQVLTNSSKVLVDVKKGSPFFYLPLDKISAAPEDNSVALANSLAPSLAPSSSDLAQAFSAVSAASPFQAHSSEGEEGGSEGGAESGAVGTDRPVVRPSRVTSRGQ